MCQDGMYLKLKNYLDCEVLNVKKTIFKRCLLGFPLGIAVGQIISVLVSLCFAGGNYSPCVPELIDVTGSEINAVLLQTFLSGILGVGFAGSSVIWEQEDWSVVKQTGIYFLTVSLIMMPTAYFTYWMEHSLKGILSYFGIFALIFVIIWIFQYAIAKRNVKRMNENLCKSMKDKGNSKH